MIAGRYQLEREIGRGGMGAVWLARDEVLGRRVAIKRTGMGPGATTPDQARAEREARLGARLSHPHVVAVFDLVHEDETQWLVMEYVDGVTLSGLVDRDGALTPERAGALMAQAADALAAAHDEGIVHRDVKPSNMLVAPDGHVKLLDFGIARADSDLTLTATGLVTGSPAYLAPEVASGHGATPASDVWSLGATAFHALSGRPPYAVGDNLMGALYRIVHEDPPRLADAGWLGPMLDATMTKDVERRWPMRQVHDFLAAGPSAVSTSHRPDPGSATQVMTPVTDAPDPPPPQAPVADEEGQHRRRPLLPVLLVAAVVLAVGLAAWALLAGGGDESPPAASPSREPSSPSREPSSGTSGPKQPGPTQEGMETFIDDYLATAPSSPETTYEMLTPAFQRASGGFDGYSGFWNTIDSAEPAEITADPDAMTVAYTVDYVGENGKSSDDDVVLRLAFRGGRYLIAGEN